ncbi:MAG: hypothetical protein ACM3SP_18725 [Chloroflexota bacterium]
MSHDVKVLNRNRPGGEIVAPSAARWQIRRLASGAEIFFRAARRYVIFSAMIARLLLFGFCAVGLSACAASTTASRGATLLSGMKEYQGDMQSLGASPLRWPDRQRAGGTLKEIITVTVGVSPEFFRLIDLDIRRREFEITMRETHVPAARMKEMKEELVQMNDEISALKPVIRTQLAAIRLDGHTEPMIEEAATRGLLSLALDEFSPNGGSRGLDAPSTKVGQYLVTDLGSFATVRAPDGQSFRCVVFGIAEEGAGMKCEPVK